MVPTCPHFQEETDHQVNKERSMVVIVPWRAEPLGGGVGVGVGDGVEV